MEERAAQVRARVLGRRFREQQERRLFLETAERRLREGKLWKREVRRFDGVTEMCIVDSALEQGNFARRAEQTWNVQKQLVLAKRDVHKAERQSQVGMERLEKISSRLQMLRNVGKRSGRADEEVDEDLAEMEASLLQKLDIYCEKCCSAVVVDLQELHQCEESLEVRETFLLPSEPRNLRITCVTADSASFSWDPPIFWGEFNLKPFNYVMEWEGNEIDVYRLCHSEPCATNEFRIDGLRANAEYGPICIRAVNLGGRGPPSNLIETVKTKQQENPDAPAMLILARASPTSLLFVWSEPMNLGGGPLHCFEISYFFGLKGEPQKVRVMPTSRAFELNDLQPKTSVFSVSVIAITSDVNRSGKFRYSSSSNMLDHVVTLMSSKEKRLRQEIARVEAISDSQVDSELYAGFLQRYDRLDLLSKLQNDLSTSKKLQNGEEEWQAFPMEILEEVFGFDGENAIMTLRKLQEEGNEEFCQQEKSMHTSINSQERRSELIRNRTSISTELSKLEERLMTLRAELDRANAHCGDYFDSKVLHHRSQRFTIKGFRTVLENEIHEINARVAERKKLQIEIQRSLEKLSNGNARIVEGPWVESQTIKELFNEEETIVHEQVRSNSKNKVLMESVEGIGSAKLLEAESMREDLQDATVGVLANIRHTSSSCSSEKARILLEQGQHYFEENRLGQAEKCLLEEIRNLHAEEGEKDISSMCRTYLLLAQTTKALGKVDHALVYFDRVHSLAQELKSQKQEAEAFLGLASCEILKERFHPAIEIASRAFGILEGVPDHYGMSQSCILISKAHEGLQDIKNAETYRVMGKRYENMSLSSIKDNIARLEDSERRLKNVSVKPSDEITLEVASGLVPDLRENVESKRLIAEEFLKAEMKHKILLTRDIARKNKIEHQLDSLKDCVEENLDSDLIHGVLQRFRVQELQDKLNEELSGLEQQISERKIEIEKAEIRGRNALDDLQEAQKDLAIEVGPLMKKCQTGEQQVRLVALNQVNTQIRDVNGEGSGGIPRFCAAVRDSIFIFNISDGSLEGVLEGSNKPLPADIIGQKGRKPETKIPGHFGSVSALFYTENLVVSAGTDCKIRIWMDQKPFYCISLLEGHEGTVWSIWANPEKIVSGAADLSVRIWDVKRQVCVRTLANVHKRSVKCLDVDLNSVATGGADYFVKVWPEVLSSSVRREIHLNGHGCPITCVKLSATELVSGGQDGQIVIWDVETKQPLCRYPGHSGSIRSLQMDTSKLVSVSLDHSIRVFDITSGNSLLTLLGHEDKVLAMQFDPYRLLTVSADGKLRRWFWSNSKSQPPLSERLHVVQPGETISKLAKRFHVSQEAILKWNSIHDASKTMYAGMRLIVSKPAVNSSETSQNRQLSAQQKLLSTF